MCPGYQLVFSKYSSQLLKDGAGRIKVKLLSEQEIYSEWLLKVSFCLYFLSFGFNEV